MRFRVRRDGKTVTPGKADEVVPAAPAAAIPLSVEAAMEVSRGIPVFAFFSTSRQADCRTPDYAAGESNLPRHGVTDHLSTALCLPKSMLFIPPKPSLNNTETLSVGTDCDQTAIG